MDQASLVMDEIEAGADLIRELNLGQYAPVDLAFWLKRDEEDERTLYIASDRFDRTSLPAAYEELLKITDRRPSIFLDPLTITLIAGDDRMAVAAKQFANDTLGTRLRSTMFGRRFIADAYVYPTTLGEQFPRFHLNNRP